MPFSFGIDHESLYAQSAHLVMQAAIRWPEANIDRLNSTRRHSSMPISKTDFVKLLLVPLLCDEITAVFAQGFRIVEEMIFISLSLSLASV